LFSHIFIPLLAEGGEVLRTGVTGLNGSQRGARPGDAEHLLDRQSRLESDLLREMTQRSHCGHRPPGRRQLARNQPQQSGFLQPVPSVTWRETLADAAELSSLFPLAPPKGALPLGLPDLTDLASYECDPAMTHP
ncbi:MAG TPA: hypothetical protein VFO16_12600, partial [Pseudonocardiaceae bacterium]|nr:hypothetical protein [Pseudonocardiaceae bacterium]